jgi:hypothetical protein
MPVVIGARDYFATGHAGNYNALGGRPGFKRRASGRFGRAYGSISSNHDMKKMQRTAKFLLLWYKDLRIQRKFAEQYKNDQKCEKKSAWMRARSPHRL